MFKLIPWGWEQDERIAIAIYLWKEGFIAAVIIGDDFLGGLL